MSQKVPVPVSIHLDHGDSFAICKEALELGLPPMIDGSTLSIKENAEFTKKGTGEVQNLMCRLGRKSANCFV
ncbi:class II fructose-bisphosphate aldolase [Lucifera butyrica]|uniref:class II fructose-bisphosphate aldolase n=1 Tax=Lucifera butyrica TaxID=1351585 RepID=UPI001A9F707F|nr:class II fructose-bisphosphate aldolase [Lucifera butyrica]